MPTTCPNCEHATLREFYRVEKIPAQSCLLVDTRDDALAFPRGDLALCCCDACGFITNSLFDERVLHYSDRYEETQGFSPTFGAYARKLAKGLIDRYSLRGKRVLEIGCGKGEFVALLCELGMGSGVGIDPAYVPGRLTGDAASRVEFLRENYSPAHASIDADLVVCRHTFEHVPRTLELLRLLRANLGGRRTPVVFEVPDTRRVLREGAFWDIYYEHCSYFTPGSLARVFRLAGFEVTDLWLEYDDQYLLIAARPGDGSAGAPLALEESPTQDAELVRQFAATSTAAIVHWRKRLADLNAQGARMVLWGGSSKSVGFLTTLGVTGQIEYCVDINPYKRGKFMPGTGQRIIAPEELVAYKPTHAILTNPIYTREISDQLAGFGLRPELIQLTGT